jgi:tetratricopeptide (TPR) repeat protein
MAELWCALCGRPRAECTRLVEGERGAVCIDCVAPAVTALEAGDSIALTLRVVEDVLAHLAPKTPTARARAVIDAAAALAEGDDATLRRIAFQALRLSQPASAMALLERIKAREPADGINIAFACWRLGRAQQGLAALDAATSDPRVLDPGARISSLLVRVALRLEAERELGARALDELRALLEEARVAAERYALVDGQASREFLVGVAEGRAACALRAGDPSGALAALEAGRRYGELGASALLLEGDVRAALGDHRGASEAWTRAWKAAHPDSREALEARRRFAGPYR